MEKKLSIIIPVYNTGEYLRACLDSVLMQTMDDWELILIDDGSRDNSGAICDEYAEKDARIRVIRKENEGVSVARNLGLSLAKGEYIGFVDSDDQIDPGTFEAMYAAAKNSGADIVMCDAVTVYGDGRTELDTITQLQESGWSVKETWTSSLLTELAGAVWRCIYRRELLEKHRIRFPEGLRFSEDRIFNLYTMGYADGVAYCKAPYYRRLMRQGSAVHKFYPDYFDIVKDAHRRTQTAVAEAWGNDEVIRTAYLSQFVGGTIAAVNNYFYRTSTLTLKERWEKVRELCEDGELREVLTRTDFGGVRRKWMLKKRIGLLCLCAQVLNWKCGR